MKIWLYEDSPGEWYWEGGDPHNCHGPYPDRRVAREAALVYLSEIQFIDGVPLEERAQ